MKRQTIATLVALLVCGVAGATQDSTLTQREVRDPRKLETWLEANATDAETRVAAIEAGTGVDLVTDKILVGNDTSNSVQMALQGDVTISQDGTNATAAIAAGVVVNADLSAAAAIAHTKLAPVLPTYIVVGNAESQAVAVVVSGDATLASDGTVTLADNAALASEVGAGIFPSDVVYSNVNGIVTASNGVYGGTMTVTGSIVGSSTVRGTALELSATEYFDVLNTTQLVFITATMTNVIDADITTN